ncbi:MAG: prepilin-type N-terminal cleavage/methylation domain-containing protein [Pseudomonadota bacterium]
MNKQRNKKSGFSLIELIITVAIVAVLTAVALPSFRDYLVRVELSELALKFDQMEFILNVHYQQNGSYPNDTHIIPPAGVDMPDYWLDETLIGGNFNWEGPNNYPYAGISILGATAPERHIQMLDRLIDNGDINSGKFRLTPNGRHTYILDE